MYETTSKCLIWKYCCGNFSKEKFSNLDVGGSKFCALFWEKLTKKIVYLFAFQQYSIEKSEFKQQQIMLRLSQFFPHPRKATTVNQKIARRVKDKIELCLGIDPTRNKILSKFNK